MGASAGAAPARVPPPRTVFVTGATGYLGRRLVPALLARGHIRAAGG